MKFPSGLRTPVGAAALSAVFPGLGQAAAGKPARGAIVAIPALTVLAAFGLILIFFRKSILDSAFDSSWLTSLLLLDLVGLLYHLWAVADSYMVARSALPRRRRQTGPSPSPLPAVLGIFVIISGTVVFHAGVASLDVSWQTSINCLQSVTGPCFARTTLAPGQTVANSTDPPDVAAVDPSTSPGTSDGSPTTGASADPNATFDPKALPSFNTPVEAKNWAADGQLNVLLVGVDAGLGGSRNVGLRPDTMIVLHVDIKTGRAAMIGIPRNTMCVPLPQALAQNYPTASNGCPAYTWPNMLNWLANDAGWNHPASYPFYQGAGLEYTRAVTATQEAISALTGLTIDGFVVINLDGLITLINDLGGIDITVPTTVYDKPCGPKGSWQAAWYVCAYAHSGYELPDDDGSVAPKMKADAAASGGLQSITWQSSNGADIAFTIKAGPQHMSGEWALAYARTREFTTDYNRMMRQQLVLKAMRTTLDPCKVLPQVPSLINNLGSAFWTNMPLTDASQWAGMAKYIVGGSVKSITLDPTTLGVNTTYISAATWATAKSIVAHSLDSVPAATGSGGSSGGAGGFGC